MVDCKTKRAGSVATVGYADYGKEDSGPKKPVADVAFVSSDGRGEHIYVAYDATGNGKTRDEFDDNSIETIPFNAKTQNNKANDGKTPLIRNGEKSIGGQKALVAVTEADFDHATIVYVPRAGSKMYAGAVASQFGYGGVHGVFGRTTTAAEVAARAKQGETASYRGYAATSVLHPDLTGESGLFTDENAKGQVNFTTRGVTLDARMTRERQKSAGTDTVILNHTGSFDAKGVIRGGTTTLTGIEPGKTIAGNMDARLYGPNGEPIGGTFIAGNGENGTAGHLILNQKP